MSSYKVTHLHSGRTFERQSILINKCIPHALPPAKDDLAAEEFHRYFPGYCETKLHSLPSVAEELGFAFVFIKDESTRFGLPSFKILGASWAIHRAICQQLGLPPSTALATVKQALADRGRDIRLVTCTEGNWGRAVARTAAIFGVRVTVYVPGFTSKYTQDIIRGEGADLRVLEGGTYDDTIAAVVDDAKTSEGLMVMDTSWKGYEQIPAWVTRGYHTMLQETDNQIKQFDGRPDNILAIGSVGVGSWMHAVTSHYQDASPNNKIVTAEPENAACFKESLHCDCLTSIQTGETIMCGMNCGTPSKIAWSVLKDGVYASVAVTDRESHEAVRFLHSQGVDSGPCGAATLAALRKLCTEGIFDRKDRSGMSAVLFSTEGNREYDVPN